MRRGWCQRRTCDASVAFAWLVATLSLECLHSDSQPLPALSSPSLISPRYAFLGEATVFHITGLSVAGRALCVTSFGAQQQAVEAVLANSSSVLCTVAAPAPLEASPPVTTAFLAVVNASQPAAPQPADAQPPFVYANFSLAFVPRPRVVEWQRSTVAAAPGGNVWVQIADFAGLQSVLGAPLKGALRVWGEANPDVAVLECDCGAVAAANVSCALPAGASAIASGRHAADVLLGASGAGAPQVALSLPAAPPPAPGDPLHSAVSFTFDAVAVSLQQARVAYDAVTAAAPAAPPALTLRLNHAPATDVAATLRLVWASGAALGAPPAAGGAGRTLAASAHALELALPADADAAVLATVTFSPGSPLAQEVRLAAPPALPAALGASDLVLQVAAVRGAALNAAQLSTQIERSLGKKPTVDASAPSAPSAAVVGTTATFRGYQFVRFNVKLDASASELAALQRVVVQWSLEFLDDTDAPGPSVQASMFPDGASGTLTWTPGAAATQEARAAVVWDRVPYDARWRLRAQLAGVLNARPAAAAANATAAVLYGVPRYLCPPGAARASIAAEPTLPPSGARGPPGAPPRITALLLQSSLPQPRYVSTQPQFQGNVTHYSAVVEHNATATDIVVVTNGSLALDVSGCGVSALNRSGVPYESSVHQSPAPAVYTLTLPLPVDEPRTAPCNVTIAPTAPVAPVRSYTMTVTRLSDPRYAALAGVTLVIGFGLPPALVCAHPDVLAEAARRRGGAPPTPGFPPGAASVLALLAAAAAPPPACGGTGVPAAVAALAYVTAPHVITVKAVLMYPDVVGTQASIGQRVFGSTGGSLADTSVQYDVAILPNTTSSDAERWLPFTVDPTPALPAALLKPPPEFVMDVPVTVALADGFTSSEQLLKVGIAFSWSPGVKVANMSDLAPGAVATGGPAWPQDPLAPGGQCSQCNPGFYSYALDSAVCLRCPPGHIAPASGMTSCQPCAAGSYTPIHGSTFCSPCLWSFYASQNGSSACALCPSGFTTSTEGAAVCDVALAPPPPPASGYSLLVTLGVMLDGMPLAEVPARLGVRGRPADLVAALIRSDASNAFNISQASVNVLSVQQVASTQVRVKLTADIAINLPPGASEQDIAAAIAVAQLSKDKGIANLSWGRTTQALGVDAFTIPDETVTQLRGPVRHSSWLWAKILFPMLAFFVIVGTLVLLWRRTSLFGSLSSACVPTCGGALGACLPRGWGRGGGGGGGGAHASAFHVFASGASALFGGGLRTSSGSSGGGDSSRFSIEISTLDREVTARKRNAPESVTPRVDEE